MRLASRDGVRRVLEDAAAREERQAEALGVLARA